MRSALITIILINAALLGGCATTDTQGTGTATPPVNDLAQIGSQIDKADARVSAGVQVARSANAQGKPAVVEKELAVVASYLPVPDPHNLGYIAERVRRNDPAEYDRAMAAGAKLLAVIDANWVRAEQDAAKNKQALDNANARLVELSAEVERVKSEGIRNAFTVAAGACFLAALGLAILGQYIRAGGAFAVGGGIGALPYVFASEYFLPTVAGIALLVVVMGAVYFFRKPNPTPADDQTPPANP